MAARRSRAKPVECPVCHGAGEVGAVAAQSQLAAVMAWLGGLTLTERTEVLAASARQLALNIDFAQNEKSLPSLTKELRATLDAIAPPDPGDDDDDDDWTNQAAAAVGAAPNRDAKKPRSGDARSAGRGGRKAAR